MGEERYFIYYTHNGSHHWMNTDSELGVLRFAATQNRCNERDGFECRKIKKVLKVEVIDRYEVRPSFGLYKINKPDEDNNDQLVICDYEDKCSITKKCPHGQPHLPTAVGCGPTKCTENLETLMTCRAVTIKRPNHLAEPCKDSCCPVVGPHTKYNCHKIPRCHNPHCDVEQGTHWTKDCKWTEEAIRKKIGRRYDICP